jgi:hypothetical protein
VVSLGYMLTPSTTDTGSNINLQPVAVAPYTYDIPVYGAEQYLNEQDQTRYDCSKGFNQFLLGSVPNAIGNTGLTAQMTDDGIGDKVIYFSDGYPGMHSAWATIVTTPLHLSSNEPAYALPITSDALTGGIVLSTAKFGKDIQVGVCAQPSN